MASTTMEKNSAPLYAAFISYAHSDGAQVAKLHSRLEAYRLPKDLRNRESAQKIGDPRGRLGKIFRDREDLSAAHNLSSAIREALDHAQVLLVACSPAAKESRWVGLEIEYFREKHPDRPILTAILEGEPEDAFPETLTADGTEPLAADLRAVGDGWQLGSLKLIAGIADLPLDALIQRDSQRKMRRVMAVTCGVALIAIAMGVMTSIALQARDEARFQRDQADGLVGYMMEDLRSELRGVGRLDVMEGVNERALDYYAQQGNPSDLSPNSLEQRAAILHAQGEDFERAGNLEAALEKFTEAHRDTGELLVREPNNPDRVFSHAQSEFWVGFAARVRDLELVDQHWSGYLALAEKLQELEPDTKRSAMELGYAHGNMCELRSRQDRFQPALEFCRESVSFMELAVERDNSSPATVLALANRHGWLAETFVQVQQPEEALNQREAEVRLLDNLLNKDPANTNYQFRKVWALIGKAEVALIINDPEAVIDILSSPLDDLAKLNAKDPSDGEIALVRVKALMLRAKAKHQIGDNWQVDYEAAVSVSNKYADYDLHLEMKEFIDDL